MLISITLASTHLSSKNFIPHELLIMIHDFEQIMTFYCVLFDTSAIKNSSYPTLSVHYLGGKKQVINPNPSHFQTLNGGKAGCARRAGKLSSKLLK